MNDTISGETVFTVPAGRQEVVIERVFDAPRELVFDVMTSAENIPHWWGPRDQRTVVDVYEPRAGGRWRFFHPGPGGIEYAFHGVYHDVVAPERVVGTFEFEGVPGHVILESVTLEDLGGGQTRLRNVSVYQSLADRDAMVASGMESGATQSMDRLAELIATKR
jgi:uncharacterized protein YndB with AHSA1/START domain